MTRRLLGKVARGTLGLQPSVTACLYIIEYLFEMAREHDFRIRLVNACHI
jgi:hypothetical protein